MVLDEREGSRERVAVVEFEDIVSALLALKYLDSPGILQNKTPYVRPPSHYSVSTLFTAKSSCR